MAAKRRSKGSKAASVKLKTRQSTSRARGQDVVTTFGRFLVPMIISAVLLGCLGLIAYLGYDRVTASQFFALKTVDVRGTSRTPVEDVRRIVQGSAERTGVWNADLSEIRGSIEKFPFVKTAAVSRSLPSGIRVTITERVPAAVVQLSSGKHLVDSEGMLLAVVKGPEKEFPFVLHGWDETKTDKAQPGNLARLKVYSRMLEEWKQFDLASRVKHVNITNPRDPVAVVEDSGREIAVSLSRDDLGKSLRSAIEVLSGKGARVKSIDAAGIYPVISYLE